MNRRTLFAAVASLPLFGWLARSVQAKTFEPLGVDHRAGYIPPQWFVPVTGAARRYINYSADWPQWQLTHTWCSYSDGEGGLTEHRRDEFKGVDGAVLEVYEVYEQGRRVKFTWTATNDWQPPEGWETQH